MNQPIVEGEIVCDLKVAELISLQGGTGQKSSFPFILGHVL